MGEVFVFISARTKKLNNIKVKLFFYEINNRFKLGDHSRFWIVNERVAQ